VTVLVERAEAGTAEVKVGGGKRRGWPETIKHRAVFKVGGVNVAFADSIQIQISRLNSSGQAG
jgi:hypothetical protein